MKNYKSHQKQQFKNVHQCPRLEVKVLYLFKQLYENLQKLLLWKIKLQMRFSFTRMKLRHSQETGWLVLLQAECSVKSFYPRKIVEANVQI